MLPAIYIDQSHEFTFAAAWRLPQSLAAFARTTVGECTLSLKALTPYHILLLQSDTQVRLSRIEAHAIREFVATGKGLLVVGSGPQEANGQNYPLNDLLAEILPSVQFASSPAVTPLYLTEWGRATLPNLALVEGINRDAAESERRLTTLRMTPSPNLKPLLVDARGIPVMIAADIGRGRVLVSGDPAIALPRRDGHLPSGLTILIGWLQSRQAGEQPEVRAEVLAAEAQLDERIYPEHELRHGNLSIYYSDTLADHVQTIVGNIDRIYTLVRDQHGDELDHGLKVVLFASRGSGYAATGEIGIGVLGPEAMVLAVLAHELTHQWVHPAVLPTSLNEGWASLVASRVLAALGFEKESEAERESFRTSYKRLEQERGSLDLRQWPGGPPLGPGYMGKAMALIERAEARYGPGFTVDFLRKAKEYIRTGRYESLDNMEVVAAVAAEVLQMKLDDILAVLTGNNGCQPMTY